MELHIWQLFGSLVYCLSPPVVYRPQWLENGTITLLDLIAAVHCVSTHLAAFCLDYVSSAAPVYELLLPLHPRLCVCVCLIEAAGQPPMLYRAGCSVPLCQCLCEVFVRHAHVRLMCPALSNDLCWRAPGLFCSCTRVCAQVYLQLCWPMLVSATAPCCESVHVAHAR